MVLVETIFSLCGGSLWIFHVNRSGCPGICRVFPRIGAIPSQYSGIPVTPIQNAVSHAVSYWSDCDLRAFLGGCCAVMAQMIHALLPGAAFQSLQLRELNRLPAVKIQRVSDVD